VDPGPQKTLSAPKRALGIRVEHGDHREPAMPLLRDKAPAPLATPRKPNYPRALEIGALLLLGACSRGSDAAPQEVPPPQLGGSVTVLMTDAEAPPPPAPMGTVAAPIVEAGPPDAGGARDAGARDAGKKVTTSPTHSPRTAGVAPPSFHEKDLP